MRVIDYSNISLRCAFFPGVRATQNDDDDQSNGGKMCSHPSARSFSPYLTHSNDIFLCRLCNFSFYRITAVVLEVRDTDWMLE